MSLLLLWVSSLGMKSLPVVDRRRSTRHRKKEVLHHTFSIPAVLMAHRAQPGLPTLNLLDLFDDLLQEIIPLVLSDWIAIGRTCKTLRQVSHRPAVVIQIKLPASLGTSITDENQLAYFASHDHPIACFRLGHDPRIDWQHLV